MADGSVALPHSREDCLMPHRRIRWFGLTMIALSATAFRVGAQTITIGDSNTGANCIPFGCGAPFNNIPGFQQVFTSSLFSQMVAISALDFFRTASPGNLAGGTFNFFLGYT